jgi:hypothetical protein
MLVKIVNVQFYETLFCCYGVATCEHKGAHVQDNTCNSVKFRSERDEISCAYHELNQTV